MASKHASLFVIEHSENAPTDGNGFTHLTQYAPDGLSLVADAEGKLSSSALKLATLTVLHTDFDELELLDTSEALDIGLELPAGARILGVELRLATAFSGGGNAVVTVDIGGTDADAITDGADVFTGAAAAQSGPAGINTHGNLGGQQLTATFTADVGLAELTAGSVVIDVLYSVVA